MIWNLIDKIGRVLSPVLIHYLVSNLIVMIGISFGLHVDAAFLTGITAAVLLPLFLQLYRKDMADSEKKREACSGLIYLGIAVAGIICNLFFSSIAGILVRELQLDNTAQETLFSSSLISQFLGIGILVPCMEEVLFRGLVYKRMKEYTGNGWVTIFLASAVFAVYHGNVAQMLFAFPMAVLITWIYRRFKTLAAPIVFHAAVNVSSILLTMWT